MASTFTQRFSNKNDKVLYKLELAKHPYNNLSKYIPLNGR